MEEVKKDVVHAPHSSSVDGNSAENPSKLSFLICGRMDGWMISMYILQDVPDAWKYIEIVLDCGGYLEDLECFSAGSTPLQTTASIDSLPILSLLLWALTERWGRLLLLFFPLFSPNALITHDTLSVCLCLECHGCMPTRYVICDFLFYGGACARDKCTSPCP